LFNYINKIEKNKLKGYDGLEKLKTLSSILAILGIVLIIYGWTQGMTVAIDSDVYYQMSTLRTIRKYISISLGGVLLLVGYITDIVATEYKELAKKVGVDKHKY